MGTTAVLVHAGNILLARRMVGMVQEIAMEKTSTIVHSTCKDFTCASRMERILSVFTSLTTHLKWKGRQSVLVL